MAVSGLEQRFAPLILTQPVWSPWGIGVLTPWSYEDEDDEQLLQYATKTPKPEQNSLKRSRSWGGLATFAQNVRYEQLFGRKAAESKTSTENRKIRMMSNSSNASTDVSTTESVADMTFSTDSDDSAEPIEGVPKKQTKSKTVKQTMPLDPDSVTTIAVRNLPFSVTREELLRAVDASGFESLYDFVYLPHKFKEHRNLGFAFINFVDVEVAQRFAAEWHKSRRFMVKGMPKGVKPINVTMATVQGHAANTQKSRGAKMTRVRNTSYQPLMLASILGMSN